MKHLFFILFIFMFSLPSCGGKGENDRYSMKNIVTATAHVIRDKGITSVSGAEINAEIERMYSGPEDVLQKRSTLRQRSSDGATDYSIIFEETIQAERERKDKEKKDPFKN
jgi:hypothetical protein